MQDAKEYILTLSCPDATGIVHAVSGLLYQAGCNIVDSQQFARAVRWYTEHRVLLNDHKTVVFR